MKKKITNLSVLLLMLFVAILSVKCASEEQVGNNGTAQNAKVDNANKWFTNYESSSENYSLFQNLDYDWNEAKITASEDGTETIIVPINEAKSDSRDFWEQRLYIYKTGKEDYKALVYEIYTNKYVEEKSKSFEGGSFTGFVSVWDLKNGFVRAASFENNKVVETGTVEVVDYSKRKATNKAPIEAPCVYSDWGDGGCGGKSNGGTDTTVNGGALRDVVVTAPSNGSTVVYFGPRSPVIGGGDAGGYTSPNGGGANTGGGITAPTTTQIIDALTGKAKCINALLNSNGDTFMQKLLSKFAGKSEFDIQISSQDKVYNPITNAELNGLTTYPGTGKLIDIKISTNRIDKYAGLEGARIIMHEYIHADMIRKLRSVTDINSIDVKDFKQVYEKYGENFHSAMGILYVESMRDVLKEFHKNIFPDDYQNYINYYGVPPSDDFYEALAWGGLQEENVKAWQELTPEKKASITSLAQRVTQFTKAVPCTQ
ncbi:hypothetical protein [Flavobacterium sp. 3-210]